MKLRLPAASHLRASAATTPTATSLQQASLFHLTSAPHPTAATVPPHALIFPLPITLVLLQVSHVVLSPMMNVTFGVPQDACSLITVGTDTCPSTMASIENIGKSKPYEYLIIYKKYKKWDGFVCVCVCVCVCVRLFWLIFMWRNFNHNIVLLCVIAV